MPGLIGYVDRGHKYNRDMLLNMRGLLKHFDSYVDDELFSDKNIYGSRTHLGVINQGEQPYIINNRFFLWMEGEFYNQEELRYKYNIDFTTDNELLANIYNLTRSFEFLRDIDGYYTAALYDKKENKVYLITDRYGFKPLYWGIINGNLVWSSEVKGFLGHIDFKPVIDRQSVEEFFDFGYLLENRTWFEGIELVSPAAVLVFDIQKSKVEIQHYWVWSNIEKVMKDPIDKRMITEELGRLFKDAVRKRLKNTGRIGVYLSGGLDSRAIFAAVPEDYILHAFTFGQEGCDDIKIAGNVAEIKGAEHHVLKLNSNNWFMPRISGIWQADASCSLLHMHGMEFTDEIKSFTDFNLNGFAGDLVLGGSYLNKRSLDKKINSSIVKNVTHSEKEISNFNYWYMINKTDPYFINNRVRRFTNNGLILQSELVAVRMPFFDNKLVDFVYSLPDGLRYKSYIYKKMLLNIFPEYFNNIPWQKTGYAISLPNLSTFITRAKNKILRKMKWLGLKLQNTSDYTDYPNWIRQEPVKSFFERVIQNPNSLYGEYISMDKVKNDLSCHFKGEDKAEILCLYLSFEIWLQQVFKGKYRSSKEDLL